MAPDARRFTVVLSAPALDRATASDFVERHIRPALERVRGVRQVTACGSAPAIVTIEIDPDRLGAHGATLADIEPAVAGARTIEEIDAAPLPGARGAAVRDIARVGRAAELAACRAMTAAGPVVSIEVVASAEAAPGPALTDAVSALASTLPAGAELRVLAPGRDQTWVEIWFDVPVGADDLARGVIERLGDVSSAVALVVEQRDPSAVDGDHPALRALAVSGDRAGLLAAAAKLPFRARVPADEARFRIRGDDGDALRTAAERAVGQLSGGSDAIAAAGIAEPEPSTVPSVELEIDRDRATQLGVTAGDIARVVELAAGPGGKPIGRIADGTPVHLRLAGAAVAGGRTPAPEQLSRLTVRARDGAVPISSVVKIELGQEPLSILRIDRQRAIELWVAPRPGATTEAALAAAKARLASFELPQGTTLDWGD